MAVRILVFTPDGFPQAGILSCAYHIGCTPVLALDCAASDATLSVLRLLAEANTEFWVAHARPDHHLRTLVGREQIEGLKGVVLTDARQESLADSVSWGRQAGLEVMVQVTSLEEALRAVECGAEALVIKGSESGGRVGEETISILLQRIIPHVQIPVYARGGIGLHTAAGSMAAGAAGVVLDWQLALAEESSLPPAVKSKIKRMDGSETAILGQNSSARFRAFARIGETAFFELKTLEESAGLDASSSPEALARWEEAVAERIRKRELLAIGQDAAFAAFLADEFRTVKGICRAIRREAGRQLRVASQLNPLGENGPLAVSHGTRFPILQGPMTRVSDNADFALAVASGGALPFLALALMRAKEAAKLLEETKEKLGSRSWGVGILGFVPKELRDEQLAEVKKVKPPYIIIAGGRPDMAKEFEADGMHVYLHVPSPELTRNFLEAGARRVIFEGRECGGHVGPRTSFVLWEQMVRVILHHLRNAGANTKGEDYHVVFAGGIHDARSAAMVAAITAPLAERGVRIGVVIGTGYLFTKEIVSTRAITATFQEEAVRCQQTVLVESGVGHATRCAESPFAEAFAKEKQRLLREGKPKEEIRMHLEGLNLGRLRIASKGIVRHDHPGGKAYKEVDAQEVRHQGMFMIGQLAALRDQVCSVEELHQNAADGGLLLKERVSAMLAEYRRQADFSDTDIAVVGLSAILPKADSVQEYFQNILDKQYAIGEVPKERWDPDVYFEKDRRAKDKIYSRWGGFINDVAIDPVKFGMPPFSLASIDPLQLMTLEFVERALRDAGYAERKFDREHTCCIVGAGGGVAELGLGYGFRSMLPYFVDRIGGTLADSTELIKRMDADLPDWTEDSFAGLLLNVIAGRVANRFDLGGTNFTVDAACATGLAAVRQAFTELETRSCKVAVVAAADMMQTPFTYLCFSKTQALSPTGTPRVFDEAGDGIVISEGIAVAIMKRVEDAILDGDHIYGVLKSVAASSDGKDKGLTAPRPIGQIRALDRAYTKAGVDPQTVGLIEAHGTGTVVGDRTETQALSTYFQRAEAAPQSVAVGSVKSMIGHTKCTAGMAGLIKAILSVRHRVLPPSLGVTKPTLEAGSPVYVNTETRPWLRRLDGAPRRAGVSAFGFGGTNFHVVLEEFCNPEEAEPDESALRTWPAELFLWRGEAAEITASLDQIQSALAKDARPRLAELAAAVYWEQGRAEGPQHLAIVATSVDDLATKLAAARTAVAAGKDHKDPRGIYYAPNPVTSSGNIAFVFPGQGSQSVGMLSDLAVAFPGVLDTFEEADSSLGMQLGRQLSSFIFPPPVFNEQEKAAQEEALKQTNVAQPALGAADIAMYRLLRDLGIRPAFACGHSYGEFAALAAAGSFNFSELVRISELRGRVIVESAQDELGTMAATEGTESQVASIIQSIEGVVIANLNGPSQTVISGTEKGVEQAVEALKANGIKARAIPVACAFHSPLVAKAKQPLRDALNGCDVKAPRFQVFSNTTAAPHSTEPEVMRNLLAEHLGCSVRFADDIRAMHDAGARTFVECGPGRVLTGLVSSILAGKPHVAINMDQPGRSGLLHLVHSLAQLATAGVPIYAYRLFEGRVPGGLQLERLLNSSAPKALAATAWVVTNGKAIPAAEYQKLESKSLPARLEERHSKRHTLLNMKENVTQTTNGHGSAAEIAIPSIPTNGHAASVALAAAGRAAASVASPERKVAAPPAVTVPAPVRPASGGQAELMLQGHHRLMSRFLETHRNIMSAYLQPQAAVAQVTMPATVYQSVETAAPATVLAVAPPVVATAPLAMAAAAGASAPATSTVVVAAPVVKAPVTAAPPAVVVAVAKEEPATPQLTRAEITKRLLDLVSQRTGYPTDMLGLDLDLEGDLGVDSIKRVEIFGALQNESVLSPAAMEGQIETLSKLKTLNAIVNWIEKKAAETAGGSGRVADAPPPAAVVEKTPPTPALTAVPVKEAPAVISEPETKPVTRMLVEVVEAPQIQQGSTHPSTVVITDDRSGAAAAFAASLEELGIPHVMVTHAPEAGVDLCDERSVATLVESLRQQHGRLDGLVHLMPLAPVASGEETEFLSRTMLDLKSLYLLTRALEKDLRASGAGVVLGATKLGGTFGCGPDASTNFFPGAGAVAGFVKTVGREWSEVAAKAIDFQPDASATVVAQLVAGEMLCRDGLVEVGYAGGARQTLRSSAAPLPATGAGLKLDGSSVVLVTGGARGITAATAIELAKTFHPRFILLGRSPLPGEEPADIAGITDMRQLKAAVMDRYQTGGQRVNPAQIESAVKRIRSDREIRSNIAALEALGSAVEYHSIDVSDEKAVAELIDGVYQRFGRIDGVVHGAGVIEDKLIADKTPESFDRVVRPKVAGALALIRKLRPQELQFLAFFSSVSARYGNRGQCDYAAANEVLDKIAITLNARWPGRVVSYNWGPWKTEGGMVSTELAARFKAAGVELIEMPAGCRAFVAELLHGRKQDAEVVFGGPLTTQQAPPQVAVVRTPVYTNGHSHISYPFAEEVIRRPNGSVEALIESHPNRHVFLLHHQIDGKPVLPMVVAMEMLAEVAASSRQDAPLTTIRNLRNLQGVTYANGNGAGWRSKNAGRALRVEGVPSSSGNPMLMDFALKCADTGHVHYRAQMEFGGPRPPAPSHLELINPRPFPLSVKEAYDRWLFHGPLLAGLVEVVAIGDNGIIGRIKSTSSKKLLHPAGPVSWLVDPVVADSCLQMGVLFCRAIFDQTPLPSRIDAYHPVAPLEEGSDILCEFELTDPKPGYNPEQPKPSVHSNGALWDESGRLVGWLEGLETTMSKALNRLGEMNRPNEDKSFQAGAGAV